jgi:DNA-binding MarR family transcriptional regulator
MNIRRGRARVNWRQRRAWGGQGEARGQPSLLTMGVQTRILADVVSRLQDELKQTRPWGTLEEEAAVSIARTAAILDHETAQVMKPFGVTPTQYNVLRILRGAGELGLCRNEVGERLVRQVPDVTRLLDRMEEMGWIDRRRSESDRRFVTTVITARGLELLAELDGPLVAFLRQRLTHLGEEQLRAVVALMEGVRSRP